MKVTNIAVYALTAITLVGCSGEAEKIEEVVEEVVPVVSEYTLDTEKSKLSWKGIEPAENEFHTGNITLSEGKAVTTDGNLTSGSFVIDMNTITVTDLDEAGGKTKLEDHLKGTKEGTAEHFFNVPKYPTVTVDVVSFDEGNLTIKLGMLGQELTETIPVELSEDGNEASITGAFEMDFSPLNIPYLMPAEGEEESKISPMIEFELDLKLKK